MTLGIFTYFKGHFILWEIFLLPVCEKYAYVFKKFELEASLHSLDTNPSLLIGVTSTF